MTQDHYAVLGINPTADLSAVKKAYRVRAIVSHPDHGGSHEAMLRINEAYGILSNPVLRQHYDQARVDQSNQSAQQQAWTDATQARQQAGHYPRQWGDFETWLAKDFTGAEYGKWGWVPTVGNSGSGTMFILAGFVFGSIATYFCYQNGTTGKVLLCLPFMGGFIGQWLHKQIGKLLHNPVEPPPNEATPNPPPTAGRPATHASGQAKGVGCAVIVGLTAFIVLCCVCQTTVGGGFFSESETDINWPGVFIGTGVCAFIAYHLGQSPKKNPPPS
jgi:DnaJ domain